MTTSKITAHKSATTGNAPKVKVPETMILYTGAANIDKAIDALHKSATKVQVEMHKIAVSVLMHVSVHKDVRVVPVMIQKLITAMPEMSRINALRAWFEHFGPVAFGADNGIVYTKGKVCDVKGAMRMPFWKFVPEQAYVPVNVESMFASIIKKLQTDQVKVEGVDHSKTITALEALVKAQTVTTVDAKANKPSPKAKAVKPPSPKAAAPATPVMN